MKYFWLQHYDLPSGLGHATFSPVHLATLAVIALFIFAAQRFFTTLSERSRNRVLRVIPVLMIFMEISKDIHLANMGRMSLDYLPLQLCGIGALVFFLAEYFPGKGSRAVFGEIGYCLILPGAVAALLFPNWIGTYPVWNFFYLYSFTWHMLLVLYPLLLKTDGDISPSIRHMWYEIVFLCCVVPPVMIFDKKTGYNYMFINYPPKGTPLEWMASFMGNPGYLTGYAILIIFALCVMYWPFVRKEKRIAAEASGRKKN